MKHINKCVCYTCVLQLLYMGNLFHRDEFVNGSIDTQRFCAFFCLNRSVLVYSSCIHEESPLSGWLAKGTCCCVGMEGGDTAR